jgi:hypothetical protein
VSSAKSSTPLTLSTSPSSDLAATLDQFVRQVGVCRAASAGAEPWERLLTADRDRLVLIVGPATSAAVRRDLPVVLERLRGLPGIRSLGRAVVNERESGARGRPISHSSVLARGVRAPSL